MGREATCHCSWGKEEADCKVLLEVDELIFRQGLRKRIPVASLAEVSVRAENLIFRVGGDRVALQLGSEEAHRWAKAIAAPRPSLARKLGISSETRLLVLGDVESKELETAIAEAGDASGNDANLVLVCGEVFAGLKCCIENKTAVPLWVVYPKGSGSAIRESTLRELLRGHGFMDTKVASVSAKLTAMRFNRRG